DAELAARARSLRSHGITSDWRERELRGSWTYDMVELGFNYRLTDLQCALGMTQLRHLGRGIARRAAIADAYDHAFAGMPAIRPLARRAGATHAHHLYVIRLDLAALRATRAEVFAAFRAEN